MIDNPEKNKIIAVIIIIGICLTVLIECIAIVPAGSRGVITTLGKPEERVYEQGAHFLIPFIQKMHHIDVSVLSARVEGEAASKDLQTVHTTTLLNYHVLPEQAVSVFINLRNDAERRIVNPALQEAFKSSTAKYTAEELVSKRLEVRNDMINILSEKLSRHGLKINEFSILNFSFSKSFNEAIEAKTTAEQLKLKADRDLQRIQVEAQQKITQAKAEAEALAAQRQQITPDLLELRRIENERAAIEKWDGKLPQITSDTAPFINFNSKNILAK